MKRSSGILMPVSSLPSPYGIGTFGKSAYEFADFLYAAGQKYWQMLPLSPTGFGDSPYQSVSSFAGNPYFIDLDLLIQDKLLKKSDLKGYTFGSDPRRVDYGKIYESRFPILAIAKANGWERDLALVRAFEEDNPWVKDYALYMACKRHFGMQPWMQWEDKKLRFRDPATLEKYRVLLREDVELFTYIQYLFFKQWNDLRRYLTERGILTIGDVPIYVPLDSADVWSEPRFFQLDENYVPDKVAGVPPDYFSADGQLWGNPLYNWDRMAEDGYGWWIRRIGGAVRLFDVVRIDHFRGFSEYWAVPYGDKTARNGQWMQGPGIRLVSTLTGWFRNNAFIAEDLGAPSEALSALLKESGLPGMKVLGFAFDSKEISSFLPHGYDHNCVCYTGTHDNASLIEWLEDASAADAQYAFDYLGMAGAKPALPDKPGKTKRAVTKAPLKLEESQKKDFVWQVIRAGQRSVADLFIAQIQDYLELGKGNRMNIPSTSGGNWSWRMLPGEATADLAGRILHLTKLYGRYTAPPEKPSKAEASGKDAKDKA